jgi:hypothetical protein
MLLKYVNDCTKLSSVSLGFFESCFMNEIIVNEPKVIDSFFVAFENLHSAYIISIVMSKIIQATNELS